MGSWFPGRADGLGRSLPSRRLRVRTHVFRSHPEAWVGPAAPRRRNDAARAKIQLAQKSHANSSAPRDRTVSTRGIWNAHKRFDLPGDHKKKVQGGGAGFFFGTQNMDFSCGRCMFSVKKRRHGRHQAIFRYATAYSFVNKEFEFDFFSGYGLCSSFRSWFFSMTS